MMNALSSWLPGLPDEEDPNDPVKKTLALLGQGASAVSQGVQSAGSALGQAASSAYDTGASALSQGVQAAEAAGSDFLRPITNAPANIAAAASGDLQPRSEADRLLQQSASDITAPIQERAAAGGAALEQATGTPAGSAFQAAQDVSQVLGPDASHIAADALPMLRPIAELPAALGEAAAGPIRRAADVLDQGLGALRSNAERTAALDAERAGQGSVSAAGTLGTVPEQAASDTSRFYHGTGGDFPAVDPGRLDPNGLYGPGYYTTSDPRVAGSYANARDRLTLVQDQVATLKGILGDIERNVSGGGPDSAMWAHQAERTRGQIAELEAELSRTTAGPNVRPLDVPNDLSLFDLDRQFTNTDGQVVSTWLEKNASPDIALTFNEALPPHPTGDDIYSALTRAYENDKTAVNDVLSRVGFDGVVHTGGQRVPMLDAAGNPIEHEVRVIFPDALPRIRQAYSGEYGGGALGITPQFPGQSSRGSGFFDRATPILAQGAASAVSGGVGAQINQQMNPDDPNAALKGFAVGALAPLAISRGARALARRAGAEAGAEGGALATFGASPLHTGPTAAEIQAAADAGPSRGRVLNRGVAPPASAVPLAVRLATKATDDRAGLRWAENALTDLAGTARLAENDPARPSTMSRVNAGSIANERVDTQLAPAVEAAGRAGLHHELVQHLEDMHQKDILDEFYGRGHAASMDASQERIAQAQANGMPPNVIARLQAQATQDADKAGVAALRKRQGTNPDMSYGNIEARLQGQEARLKASGQWQQLQDAAQAVWDHNAETRQRLADAGEMSQATHADLAQRYPHYVPTVPLSHLTSGGGGVGSSSSLVNRGTQSVVRSLEDVGTSGERLNPIVASRNATVRAEQAIQRNNTARAFAQMFDDASQASPGTLATDPNHRTFLGGGVDVHYFEDGKPMTISVPKPIADGLEAASNMGVDTNSFAAWMKRLTRTVSSTLTAARASFVPVNIARDLTDYATQTMAKEGSNPAQLPSILGSWAHEAGLASLDILRAQANPRTAAGAAVGAATGAATGDENTTVADRLRHAAEGGAAGALLLGANKVGTTGRAAEFLARGGGEGRASAGLGAGQRWYRDVLRDGGAPIRTPSAALSTLGDWFHDVATLQGVRGVNERAETISRTAAMNRAEARGASPTEAMIAGRDASYDPDRAGTLVRSWNGFVPFLNATVQGSAQFVRMLKKNPVGTSAAIAATLGPTMLATEYWNRSDPQRAAAYDDVPQYIKDSGLVVMAPWAGSDTRGSKPNYLWLPTEVLTPYVVGMRASMQNLDKVVPGVEPSAGRSDANPQSVAPQALGALNEALSVFYPVRGDSAASIGSTFVPPIARQAIELGLNKDLFRGGAIQSAGADERASGFGHAVARGANQLGQALGSDFLQNVHPSQVDYLARQVPAYGDIITGASDLLAPSPYKQAEQGRVANEPFVGGVAGRFDRDTGGANLERVQGQSMTPNLRDVLSAARMRPDDVDLTVPSVYQNAPLTRDEQLRWQQAMNAALPLELAKLRGSSDWALPQTRQQAVKTAIADARNAAAERALAMLPSGVIQQRIQREQQLQRASGY